jgi:hypothetical protein
LIDAWNFEVDQDDDVMVMVDTTSQQTAADMELRGVCEGRDPFFGDDDFLCRFAPPRFSCPAAAFVASAAATCTVDVSPALATANPPTGSCTDNRQADYELSVVINGQPAIVALVRDGTDQVCVGGSSNARSCDSDGDCPNGACLRGSGLLVTEARQKLP